MYIITQTHKIQIDKFVTIEYIFSETFSPVFAVNYALVTETHTLYLANRGVTFDDLTIEQRRERASFSLKPFGQKRR